MYSVKNLVKDKKVQFLYFKDSEFFYKVIDTDFIFPVPLNDIGTATMNYQDKAILFMRWIRKHIDNTIKWNAEINAG